MKEELFAKILKKFEQLSETQETLLGLVQVDSYEEMDALLFSQTDFIVNQRDCLLIHKTNPALKVQVIAMQSAKDWNKIMARHFGVAFISEQVEPVLKTRILSRVRLEPFKNFTYSFDDFNAITNEDIRELIHTQRLKD